MFCLILFSLQIRLFIELTILNNSLNTCNYLCFMFYILLLTRLAHVQWHGGLIELIIEDHV